MPSLTGTDLAVRITSSADTSGIDEADNSVKKLDNSQKEGAASSVNWSNEIGKAGLIAAGLAASIGMVAKNAIDQASAYQQSRVSFETMLGSADKAKSLLSKISDFAAETPFELPDVVDGSKHLLAFGVSMNDIIPTFTTLGNIAAGVGTDKLPGLINVFGQVKAAGRLMSQDLLQFTSAGVPIIDLLAQHFGTTSDKIKDMVSSGTVGFDDVKASLELLGGPAGKWGDLMEKQSKTLNGTLSNVQDNLGRILRQAVGIGPDGDIRQGSLFESLTKGATALMNGMAAAQPYIDKIVGFFEKNHDAAAALGAALLGLVAGPIIAVVVAIGWIPLAIVAAAVAVSAFAGFVVSHFGDIKDFIMKVSSIVVGIWDKWKLAFIVVGGAITGALIPAIVALGASLLGAAIPAIGALIAGFVGVGTAIFTVVIPAIIAALIPLLPFIAIGAAVAGIAYLIITNWKSIAGFFTNLWDTVKRVTVDTWNGLTKAIGGAFTAVFKTIGDAVTQFKNHFFEDIGFAIGFIITLPFKVIAAFVIMEIEVYKILFDMLGKLWKGISDTFSNIINWLAHINWGQVFNNIVNAIGGAMGAVWNSMIGTFNGVVGWIAHINWGGIFSGIGGAIWGAGQAIMNAIGNAYNYVTRLNWGAILGGIGRGIGNAIIDLINGAIRGAFSGVPILKDHIPQIPHFAAGVRNFSGGLALVGEQGPELVTLPRGSSVYSNQDSRKMMGTSVVHNHYGDVYLGDRSAVQEYFKETDHDNLLVSKGLTPNRGSI